MQQRGSGICAATCTRHAQREGAEAWSPACPQAKAYTTRVGAGPYPTEIHGEEAEELRKVGQEYGTTTGRPRRVGWLDIPALRYAARSAFAARFVLGCYKSQAVP